MQLVPRLVTVLATMMLTCSCATASPALDDIVLPAGFKIELYVDGVPNARSMTMTPGGTLFVGTRRKGSVYAVAGGASGKKTVHTVDKGLNMPNGVAFRDGDLYVAEVNRILRYADIEKSLTEPPDPVVVRDDFPTEKHHGWKYIAFGPDDKLYVPIGAPCNVCDEAGYSTITRLDPDGTGREVFVRGVRNSVGFTWHPETGEMWFTDNGRDMLGDNVPPGELNRVEKAGAHYGFPYCHGGIVKDPEFGHLGDCSEAVAPARKLGPHVAPLGLKFYTGEMFPEEYHNQIFIAEHGSWNRSEKIGYRVVVVKLRNGMPVSYEPFAHGWLQGDKVSGRPVDLLVMEDGSMLVSDDQAGVIYRISYGK